MHKVTIEKVSSGTYYVHVNGVLAATITGDRKCGFYLCAHNEKRSFIARFKYKSAVSCAKDFAKFALSRMTAEEAAERSAKNPPLVWAAEFGYEDYLMRKIRRDAYKHFKTGV